MQQKRQKLARRYSMPKNNKLKIQPACHRSTASFVKANKIKQDMRI